MSLALLLATELSEDVAAGHEVIEVRRADCDLTDFAAVQALAERLGAVDGVLHLVGGWRGGVIGALGFIVPGLVAILALAAAPQKGEG